MRSFPALFLTAFFFLAFAGCSGEPGTHEDTASSGAELQGTLTCPNGAVAPACTILGDQQCSNVRRRYVAVGQDNRGVQHCCCE